jgi:hypothetical protein
MVENTELYKARHPEEARRAVSKDGGLLSGSVILRGSPGFAGLAPQDDGTFDIPPPIPTVRAGTPAKTV